MNNQKRHILALGGARSNNVVTKLQLEHLNISEEQYDIYYLHGNIPVEEGDPELTQVVHGPFFSWLDTSTVEKLNRSVLDAVQFVLKVIQKHGPFDGVYGFSQGGLIAALVAGIAYDNVLKDGILLREMENNEHTKELPKFVHNFVSTASDVASQVSNLNASQHRGEIVNSAPLTHLTDGELAWMDASARSRGRSSHFPDDTGTSQGMRWRPNEDTQSGPTASSPRTLINKTKQPTRRLKRIESGIELSGSIILPGIQVSDSILCIDEPNGLEGSGTERMGVLSPDCGSCSASSISSNSDTNSVDSTPHIMAAEKPRFHRISSIRTLTNKTKPPTRGLKRAESRIDLSLLGSRRRVNLAEVMSTSPFKFVITACAASSKNGVDISSITCSSKNFTEHVGMVGVKSVHLVGIGDSHRSQSEQVASSFIGGQVIYMPGGHEVSRTGQKDKYITSTIKAFIKNNGHPSCIPVLTEFCPMSKVSSLAIHPIKQIARVQLNSTLLPGSKHGATIVGCLAAQPRDRPFLYNARKDEHQTTTYGQTLDFIQGGEGDLARLGIQTGQVVAYVAPPGGSAVAALAFLSIAAQTTAAPLAPSTTELDAIDALDQFCARHLILFEGVDSSGAERAFQKYSESGKANLYYAKMIPSKPGQFRFVSSKQITDSASLCNPKNGTALLLRTSGTTARPKVVPLTQSSLMNNGALIAYSMQLRSSDVCYSVMPLFHIGGIAASILCTMVSGGAVCCDNEPFDAGRMVDALAMSSPQPTWYSSVPTIHNATVSFIKEFGQNNDPKCTKYSISKDGIWSNGHSLRMIRSGAAALLRPDAEALSKTYGNIPVYPTYSMSEQMPISQPPAGKEDTVTDRPGSVGVPLVNVAIVNPANLRLQPFGKEGEVAISGITVMREYLRNPEATAKSFFYLTQEDDGDEERKLSNCRYFLTGDLGVLDEDGFLYLKGRAKELIKKGGEQVSPHEVEEALTDHPWVRTALCVSVPSKIYGEEVGCAIVLSMVAPIETKGDINIVKRELRLWLKQKQLAPYKWPTQWKLKEMNSLPRTQTKKLKRLDAAKYLGFTGNGEEDVLASAAKVETKAEIDWGVISGFRFCLACYVMFMHIGSNESWGAVNNLRGWPWHVHCFFMLGGFSMASPMNPVIGKKFAYFKSRIRHMYPLYALSLIFGLLNLIAVCRPSTFRNDFHWNAQPDDLYQPDGSLTPLFCEGAPMLKQSYWGSLALTIVIYVTGLAVTPLWPLNWWMGYYLWFMSMYFQCLALFPSMYNFLVESTRKKLGFLLRLMIGLQILNLLVVYIAWILMKDGGGYFRSETVEPNNPVNSDGMVYNVAVLSFYLFGPFWMVYFIIGTVAAFIYDAMKPSEKHNAWVWGWVADGCTLIIISLSITIICQGGDDSTQKYFRPEEANEYTDISITNRLWDNISGRITCPITTLWTFALSTGRGHTARILRSDALVNTLAPNSYGCFLFHQMVAQWYYAATRNGHFWNWWRYRKAFYWFSPEACPVEWYEYFSVVGIVVLFSSFVNQTFNPIGTRILSAICGYFAGNDDEDDAEINIRQATFDMIERMTGIEPELDSTLDEVGLASMGIPVIVGMLNQVFSTKKEPLAITQQDLVGANTIAEIISAIENARVQMNHDGV